jgi:hypothetical protein
MIILFDAITVLVQIDFTAILDTEYDLVGYTSAAVMGHVPYNICLGDFIVFKKPIKPFGFRIIGCQLPNGMSAIRKQAIEN